MAERQKTEKVPAQGPVVGLKLGKTTIKLTGALALIPIAIVLSLLGLIVYLISETPQRMLWVSAILWILFFAYWSAAAGNASATRSSESTASRRLHQLLMYGALALLFIRVPGLESRWLPGAFYFIPIGFVVQVGSALLAGWARTHLGRNWSGAITAKTDHQLIRNGPYRTLRHPIYTATLGMFLGTAIVSAELHALLGLVIISVAYWRKIRLEEQHLRAVFGDEYDEYRRKSWAVIPGIL
jgi:protein-S-isoprenylcysteine O-methyltransferase Ste14